jgi:hypothetical protein
LGLSTGNPRVLYIDKLHSIMQSALVTNIAI